jgi:rubredoxin
MVSLCKFFYERKGEEVSSSEASHSSEDIKAEVGTAKSIHQCKHCLTTYDHVLGDVENGIPPSTLFNDVPNTYKCPLCEAGKEDFVVVGESSLRLQDV